MENPFQFKNKQPSLLTKYVRVNRQLRITQTVNILRDNNGSTIWATLVEDDRRHSDMLPEVYVAY